MQCKRPHSTWWATARVGCAIWPFTQMPFDRKLGGVLPAKLGVTISPFKHTGNISTILNGE